jgi:hypothetical protein
VYPAQQALGGERLDVAARGDRRDPQLGAELGDPDAAAPAHDLENPAVTLLGGHAHTCSLVGVVRRRKSTARDARSIDFDYSILLLTIDPSIPRFGVVAHEDRRVAVPEVSA